MSRQQEYQKRDWFKVVGGYQIVSWVLDFFSFCTEFVLEIAD